jgi:pyruvate kinase
MEWTRRAKIVCTLGPATFSPKAIEGLIRAGMDVARLNFSHGDYQTYRKVIRLIRDKRAKLKKHVTILQDLQGPKIRTGRLETGKVKLKKGASIVVTTKDIVGSAKRISIPYQPLSKLLKKGNRILIDDGLLELSVERLQGSDIFCHVIAGGFLGEKKGVNLPYLQSMHVGLTAKDQKDLIFGVQQGVDFVALSFVRSAADIVNLRKKIPGKRKIGIIAKIEKREAIDVFDEILEVSDGIMVARGDLAVESSTEVVPCLQKEIIQKCNIAMKPVITATQMLESMIHHPRPTRAEASDVANAALDGSDALMLSGETASGLYPFKAVRMMDKIIREVEGHHHHHNEEFSMHPHMGAHHAKFARSDGAIEKAACEIAEATRAKLICCLTEGGKSALRLARNRPRQPIVALTSDIGTLNHLSLVWGVQVYLIKNLLKRGKIFNFIRLILMRLKLVKLSDKIIITTGIFTRSPDTAKIVKVHRI